MEELRRYCMNLARLREGFLAELEGHEKVDQVLPAEALAPLAAICCLLERDAMLRAGSRLMHYYLELARPLVAAQGVACPAKRERVMQDRMERLLLPAR